MLAEEMTNWPNLEVLPVICRSSFENFETSCLASYSKTFLKLDLRLYLVGLQLLT